MQRYAVNFPLKRAGRCHTHTKISDVHTIEKRWLRDVLSVFLHKKISGAHLIKNRSSKGVLFVSTHAKISDEYLIKKRWLRGLLSVSTHTKTSGEYTTIKQRYQIISSLTIWYKNHRFRVYYDPQEMNVLEMTRTFEKNFLGKI